MNSYFPVVSIAFSKLKKYVSTASAYGLELKTRVFQKMKERMGFRVSRQVFCKTAVLKKSEQFAGKHLQKSYTLAKQRADYRPITLLKEDSIAVAFLWILKIFSEHRLYRTSMRACFRCLHWCFRPKMSPNIMFSKKGYFS